jgi:succinate-semialdehyde dehydrogenase/glutarate-semialdehyde dehydrogenase
MSSVKETAASPQNRQVYESDYPRLNHLTDPSASVRDVVDPCTEAVIGQLPLADSSGVERALTAASRAFAEWRAVPARNRGEILHRASESIRSRVAQIAPLITLEQGKRLSEAEVDVNRAADNLEWFANEGLRVDGRIIAARRPEGDGAVVYEPVGPVAAFTPWNGPISAPARKIGTALAAGCSCVIKPAEETPASALVLAEALESAGLPSGVLNIVFGNPAEIATQVVSSPVICAVSFTGSTKVGREIARLAAPGVKRLTLELGGHAPVIVLADADIDKAVQLSLSAKFRANAGQVCISPSRFYVEAPRYQEFVDAFVDGAQALSVGDGFDPEVDMGPLANARRVQAMEALVQDAVAVGATVRAGGARLKGRGYFFEPTVLTDVPDKARVMTEEPFGPLAVIASVDSLDEALERSNRLPFGLAAYGFTGSLRSAARFTSAIEAGLVGLNSYSVSEAETPFGGIKESGYGSEGSREGLYECLAPKYIYRSWSA